MTRKGKIGMAIWCLFCAPFALFGLYALSQAWQIARTGSGTTPFWYPLIFGLAFSAVGFGFIALAFLGKKKYEQQQQLRMEHPNEPWLCRADWAQGRVKSKTRSNLVAGWFLSFAFNAVSLPFYWNLLHGASMLKQPAAVIALLFPVAGLYLLSRSIRATIASFKFGKTRFDMASVPGVLGRELKGSIEASFSHTPAHGVHLRLSCVHRVTTGEGRSQQTTESILWRDETDINAGQLCAGPAGTTIPVTFVIPLDVHPTESITTRDEYVWILEALADLPGINYHDIFEIPVFRTAASPTPQEAAATESRVFAIPAATQPEHLTVRISDTADGKEFYFPAARNPGAATTATIITVVVSGVTFSMASAHFPKIFPIVFGLFACALLYFSLRQWLGTTRVIVGANLKIQSGMLGGGTLQEIPFAAIVSIDDQITTQQGRATETPYYDLVLRIRDGSSINLRTMLRNKREAEWLVSEFRRLTAAQAQAVGAGA